MSTTTDKQTQKNWNYYLLLEQKFLETRNYVEFREENSNTSSNGFGLLIMAIGAELDNFLKDFCEIPDNERKESNMGKYKDYLIKNYSEIKQETITVLDSEMNNLSPFENLEDGTLSWWKAYNNVKHDRNTHFLDANLTNTITILSALYLLEMKMFKKNYEAATDKEKIWDCPLNKSKLFTLKNWEFKCTSGSDLVVVKTGTANVSSAVPTKQ